MEGFKRVRGHQGDRGLVLGLGHTTVWVWASWSAKARRAAVCLPKRARARWWRRQAAERLKVKDPSAGQPPSRTNGFYGVLEGAPPLSESQGRTGLIGASNSFELAVAVAITLFGANSERFNLAASAWTGPLLWPNPA